MTTDYQERYRMHWNHRVIRNAEDASLGIHEVFIEDGRITGWTADAVEVVGEDIDELRQTLAWMAEALDRPILDEQRLQRDVREWREQQDDDCKCLVNDGGGLVLYANCPQHRSA